MLPMKRDTAATDPTMTIDTIPVLMGRCVTGSSVCFSEDYKRGLCDVSERPPTAPTASVTIHRTLMYQCVFPAQSFLLLFRAEYPTV